jgi:hypothetical protein
MQRVIQLVTEMNIKDVETSPDVSPRASEEAIWAQEQRTAQIADELRVAVSEVNENAEMALRAVSRTLNEIGKLEDLIDRVEAVMGSKPILTRISSHRNCENILTFCAGDWKLMTSPQYCVDRLIDVIFGKPPIPQVILTNPSTWNGWFSDPQFFGHSVVTIKFQKGIYVVLDQYFAGRGIRGFRR